MVWAMNLVYYLPVSCYKLGIKVGTSGQKGEWWIQNIREILLVKDIQI